MKNGSENHYNTIKESFGAQSKKFSSYHMSKSEYTDYLIQHIETDGSENALEVAAGTAICGRAIAPYVKNIECLDLTQAMLEEGKRLAKQEKIENISFVAGNAEQLPYENDTFDLIITRLSLHHFLEPEKPFQEMKRVLKTGGKLIIWDMEATTEELREVNDQIETMRDASHTKTLSKSEFEKLFEKDFALKFEETVLVPVNLQNWMDLTNTSKDVQKEIVKRMETELIGGTKTGFAPYVKDGQIFFDHRWLLLVGVKK